MTQMPKKHVVEIYNITLGTAIGRWIERIAEHFFFFLEIYNSFFSSPKWESGHNLRTMLWVDTLEIWGLGE